MSRRFTLFVLFVFAVGALVYYFQPPKVDQRTVIYHAKKIITMADDSTAQAVAVSKGMILGVGALDQLQAAYPQAVLDNSFKDLVLVPGFIDPHIHMLLSAVQYALAIAPPWPIQTGDGVIQGLNSPSVFLEQIRQINAEQSGSGPLVIYGYHDLVHGPLDRHILDAISQTRPLIIWHYSSHDFYLNSKALAWAEIEPSMHAQFEGIALDKEGELTGRVFEDAVPLMSRKLAWTILNPLQVRKGFKRFSQLLQQGGVTTVADLGYGIFGLSVENLNLRFNWRSPSHSGYRVYMVPEHRAFVREYGDKSVDAVLRMVSGDTGSPAPVLPQVKFFVDAAFYSQTMRLSPPGYLAGQSQGTEGLWVTKPDAIAPIMKPYWDAGLGVRVHSNGDRAQTATLAALANLRESGDNRFVIEHAGLMSPEHVNRALENRAVVSAASHYVHYLGEVYQAALGETRGAWIEPLNSLSQAGVPVTLHSDAPLAPPLPLKAASVHLTRLTREGNVLTPKERLSKKEALEAITLDAAYALGLENELGSIEQGKRADFTILEQDPFNIDGKDWPSIGVWGVVLNGQKRPLQ